MKKVVPVRFNRDPMWDDWIAEIEIIWDPSINVKCRYTIYRYWMKFHSWCFEPYWYYKESTRSVFEVNGDRYCVKAWLTRHDKFTRANISYLQLYPIWSNVLYKKLNEHKKTWRQLLWEIWEYIYNEEPKIDFNY